MPLNGAIWTCGYVAFCLLLISGTCYVHGLGQTMADCLSVASNFRNTCPSLRNASNNVRDMPGQLVTCMDVGQCNDQTAGLPMLMWVRRLYVTCNQAGDTVRINYSPMDARPLLLQPCGYHEPKFIDYK